MSRQTANAKRIALALYYRDLFDRALRGDDDEAAQIIHRNLRAIPGFDTGFDRNNPDHVEAVKLLVDYCWPDIFSDTEAIELSTGMLGDEGLKQRKADAKAACRAKLKQEKPKHDTYEAALGSTARWARAEYPKLYEGKSDKQLRRIWSRLS
jgi:hypothetical protein